MKAGPEIAEADTILRLFEKSTISQMAQSYINKSSLRKKSKLSDVNIMKRCVAHAKSDL